MTLSPYQKRLVAAAAHDVRAARAHPIPGAAILYDAPGQMLEAMFGPSDHNAHVKAWRQHVILQRKLVWFDEADKRAQDAADAIILEIRAKRIAASNQKFTDNLARMHAAWSASKIAAE